MFQFTFTFSHFVKLFHNSSAWFHETISKVLNASAPCQKQNYDLAVFHFAVVVVLL